jgi:hypothetical protein
MIKGSDPLEDLCRSKPSNCRSPNTDAPSSREMRPTERIEWIWHENPTQTLMRKGALVIANTSEVRSLSDPMSTILHELLSQEQCALALQKTPKLCPASSTAPETE